MTLVGAVERLCRVICANFIVLDGAVYLVDFQALLTLECWRWAYGYRKHIANSSTFSQTEAA